MSVNVNVSWNVNVIVSEYKCKYEYMHKRECKNVTAQTNTAEGARNEIHAQKSEKSVFVTKVRRTNGSQKKAITDFYLSQKLN